MLSDPQNVTVDGSSRTMPRVGAVRSSIPKTIMETEYRTSDGAYSVTTSRRQHRQSGVLRSEIILRKKNPDLNSATAYTGDIITGVGFVFETDAAMLGVADLVAIRTALVAYVDTTLMNRLAGGEG